MYIWIFNVLFQLYHQCFEAHLENLCGFCPVSLGLTCVSHISVRVFLQRLAQSRTNPQVLDIGVNPQDCNTEECLSPSNWDKADAEDADGEDAFVFGETIWGWGAKGSELMKHKGNQPRCLLRSAVPWLKLERRPACRDEV